jgi:hypothetical protein
MQVICHHRVAGGLQREATSKEAQTILEPRTPVVETVTAQEHAAHAAAGAVEPARVGKVEKLGTGDCHRPLLCGDGGYGNMAMTCLHFFSAHLRSILGKSPAEKLRAILDFLSCLIP